MINKDQQYSVKVVIEDENSLITIQSPFEF